MEQNMMGKIDVMSRNIVAIREHLEDVMLTKDDLDAIEEGDKDLARGRTKRLV